MTIRKIEMRPPGVGDYADILYPKTSADIVTSTDGTVQGDIDLLQSGKSATGHTHVKTDITDFPALGTAASVNTGTGSGNVPILDASGKLNTSVLPAIAITDTSVVANQAAMLALTAEVGDIAVRSDLNKSYILKTAPASVLANWQVLLTPTDAVLSVAGRTGTVTLAEADISGLVTDLASKAPVNSPALTGTPTSVTAAANTNTTQIATTAFVVGQVATVAPLMDGVAAVGSSLYYARQDHKHPVDTSRAGLASPTFTGTPIATTAAPGDNSTRIATTAYVTAALSAGGYGDMLKSVYDINNDGIVGRADTLYGLNASIGELNYMQGATSNIQTQLAGKLSSFLTIGTVQPTNGDLWFKEI